MLKRFDLQLHAVNDLDLPEDIYSSEATVGKDYLLFVNTGTIDIPDWTLVGGQRSASLNETAEEIDVSHKTSGGYKETLPGLFNWSIDLDALVLLKDKGVRALRKAYNQRKKANIKLQYPDGTYQVGWVTVSEQSKEAPHDGEASLSGTLNGNGALSNIAVIVSLATAEDQTFDFDKTAKVKAIKKGLTDVAAANFVATVSGEVTLKGTYLETLTVGEHLFYAELTIGGYALLAVIITE